MYNLLLIILLFIPPTLNEWVGKDHEDFMDAYSKQVVDFVTHAEYGYVVDSLALGDTLWMYTINPLVVDEMVLSTDSGYFRVYVDSLGIIYNIEKDGTFVSGME